MINTNDNHVTIKNHCGKKLMEFKISRNFYGKIYLFIYSKIIYSGKYPSSNNSFFPIHRKEYDFMELRLVSRKGNNFKVI